MWVFSDVQFMSEKIGGAKGTELDDDFVALEKVILCNLFVYSKPFENDTNFYKIISCLGCNLQKADVMDKLVDELMARTHEVLQPNPG